MRRLTILVFFILFSCSKDNTLNNIQDTTYTLSTSIVGKWDISNSISSKSRKSSLNCSIFSLVFSTDGTFTINTSNGQSSGKFTVDSESLLKLGAEGTISNISIVNDEISFTLTLTNCTVSASGTKDEEYVPGECSSFLECNKGLIFGNIDNTGGSFNENSDYEGVFLEFINDSISNVLKQYNPSSYDECNRSTICYTLDDISISSNDKEKVIMLMNSPDTLKILQSLYYGGKWEDYFFRYSKNSNSELLVEESYDKNFIVLEDSTALPNFSREQLDVYLSDTPLCLTPDYTSMTFLEFLCGRVFSAGRQINGIYYESALSFDTNLEEFLWFIYNDKCESYPEGIFINNDYGDETYTIVRNEYTDDPVYPGYGTGHLTVNSIVSYTLSSGETAVDTNTLEFEFIDDGIRASFSDRFYYSNYQGNQLSGRDSLCTSTIKNY